MNKIALVIGGLSTAAAGVAALFISKKNVAETKKAVTGFDTSVVPPLATTPQGSTNNISTHLTGYWPFQAGLSEKERKMEGAPVDRKGKPLHTVEDFLAGKSDHVSLSGDYTIFPYGQKMVIPWGDRMITGRVTDTGGHFHGAGKVFRVIGAEPIDVCVLSSNTVIPKKTVDVQVVVGDHFDTPNKIAALELAGKPQTVVGLDYFGIESA